MALSDAAATAIVRGMAAFMLQARPTDIPAALRPLRGKHMKMLSARKNDIVGALEDAALRTMVVAWLEDKPTGISKPDAAMLLAAARRDDGWEKRLARAPSARKKQSSTPVPDGSVQREKERTRKARDEARRARQEAAREVAAARNEAASLTATVAELERAVEKVRAELAGAVRERDAARAELDRETRKARKRVEKAESARDEAKAQVRALRSQLREARAAAAAAAATRAAAPRRATATRAAEAPAPSRRRRLPVPQGRYEDDPATLSEWLSVPAVHLLVDGYNVSKAAGGFGDLTLATQRTRLLQELGKLVRGHKIKATIVFDGAHIPPGTARRARGPVEVEYSHPDEIADDHLIAKLEGMPKHPVVVATNDRELQRRAARLGATVATSNQLLGLIR